jgi:protein TonB
VETKIIEEVKPPPPPDLPPPPPPPEMKAPPPPFIPPVEVNVQQPPPPSPVAAVTNTKPPTTELPKAAPQAPPAPPAPPAKGPSRTAAVVDFNSCAKPEWPRSSLRNEETGTVTLSFLIGVDGKVADSKIVKSSGYRELDKAAVNGISKCVFKPATVEGKPEQGWQSMQYVWTLE